MLDDFIETKNVLDLLQEAKMTGCKPTETPIDLNHKFYKVTIHFNMFGSVMLNWIMSNVDDNFVVTIDLLLVLKVQRLAL